MSNFVRGRRPVHTDASMIHKVHNAINVVDIDHHTVKGLWFTLYLTGPETKMRIVFCFEEKCALK